MPRHGTCRYEAQKDSGYTSMKYLKALILALPFFERMPDQSIIYEDNGNKYERLACTRGNDFLLIYNYTGREIRMDLSKISGKKKRLWVMNTLNGELNYIGEYDNGKHSITTQEESVLIAIDAEKDYINIQQENMLRSKKQQEKDLAE